MNRTDIVRSLAYICRTNHGAALWTIAFLTTGVDEATLLEALQGAEEMNLHWHEVHAGHHLEAYRERWGQYPQQH